MDVRPSMVVEGWGQVQIAAAFSYEQLLGARHHLRRDFWSTYFNEFAEIGQRYCVRKSPSPGVVPVKTYRLIRWSSFPIQYSTRRSSRGSASPISIPGGTNATRWSTSTPSSCSSSTTAKLLRSDGSIGILSKGVSGTESRVSTFHSPVGGIFVYTVTPIVIASPLIVNVSLSVAKVVLPVVSN